MRRGTTLIIFCWLTVLIGCAAQDSVEEAVTWHLGDTAADICITTQYTKNIRTYAELAVRNHIAYAERNGYTQVVYRGRPDPSFLHPEMGSERDARGGGLYWQKLGAMRQTLAARNTDGTPVCRWAMWVDADIMFTNYASRLEPVIDAFTDDEGDVIVTREQAGFERVPLNSGAFFVRNSEGGRQFVEDVSATFLYYNRMPYPDQDAITDYVARHDMHRDGPLKTLRQADLRPNVRLAPQRAFNAFAGRYDHFHPNAQWRPCDLVAHITGATTQDRVGRMIANLEAAQKCTTQAPLYKDLLDD